MKLISMVDYTLNIRKSDDALWELLSYANFLKMPLTLEMFVPCDLDEVPLKSPKQYIPGYSGFNTENNPNYNEELEEYQQAEKRVLFEGFEIMPDAAFNFTVINNNTGVRIYLGERQNKVEILVKKQIELTQSAIKKIKNNEFIPTF